jgi:hypothetical protein
MSILRIVAPVGASLPTAMSESRTETGSAARVSSLGRQCFYGLSNLQRQRNRYLVSPSSAPAERRFLQPPVTSSFLCESLRSQAPRRIDC